MLFRVRRGERTTAWLGVAFFGFMTLLCGVGLPMDGEPVAFSAAMCSFWGAWLLLSLYCLVSVHRGYLDISPTAIKQFGAFREKQLPLSGVVGLRWRAVHRIVTLRDKSTRLTIRLTGFEPKDQLAIVRFVRVSIPESVQQEWSTFCHVVAMQLVVGPPDPSEDTRFVRVTRRRFDRLILICTAVAAVAIVPAACVLRQPAMVLSLVGVAPFWLFFRLMIPKPGAVEPRLSAAGAGLIPYFLVAWLVVGIVGVKLLFPKDPVSSIDEIPWYFGAFLAFWFSILFWQIHRADRRSRRRRLDGIDRSLLRWDEWVAGGDDVPRALHMPTN